MITNASVGSMNTSVPGAEELNVPPSIQPHGILLVLTEPALTIEHISANVEELLGISARTACGATLDALLEPSAAQAFAATVREPQLHTINPQMLVLRAASGQLQPFECTVARREGGGFIVELEPLMGPLEPPASANVKTSIERLRGASTIEAVLASAVQDVRGMSGFDRALIYRIEPDWRSVVVAESAAPGVPQRYLGQTVSAQALPEQSRSAYLRNPLQAIADSDYVAAPLVPSPTADMTRPVDLSRATLRSVAPVDRGYHIKATSRASLCVSIVIAGRLWGLIVCTHRLPRRLDYSARAALELLGHLLAWQLGARLGAQEQRRSARTAALLADIGAELDLEHRAEPSAAVIACLPLISALFSADGVAIRIGGLAAQHGEVPGDERDLAQIAAALVSTTTAGAIGASAHLLAVAPNVGGWGPIAGALCIQLAANLQDFLLVFRCETIRTTLWSQGTATSNAGAPQVEIVRDRSQDWAADDLAAAEVLATRIMRRLQYLPAPRDARITRINAHLEERNAQAEALITLQDDVAAALPSRAAVVAVILEFARSHTGATGSALEAIGEHEIIFEAVTGSLAPHAGLRATRSGSLSQISSDLGQSLVCDDAFTDVDEAERQLCARIEIGSMIVVPITLAENSRFVLKVVSPRRWAFSGQDTQTLKLAATHLISALRAAHKFTAMAAAELEQRTYARQLRALHTIASATGSRRQDQIEAALHLGLEQLDMDWAYMGVIDYAANEFAIQSSVSNNGHAVIATGTRLPLGSSPIAQISRSKRVISLNDSQTVSQAPKLGGFTSFIAVPLFINGENYGAIGFTSRDVRAQPFSDANIEFLAVAGELIGSAIERGLQRDQLENSQTRHSALIEAIPQMMWIIDTTDRFEYVNERWTRYTGLTLEASRAAGGDAVYHAADFAATLAGRSPVPQEFDCEVRLRRADGVYRWHLVRSVPFRAVEGGVDRWLVTATDIEARKSAETLLADVHDAALAATEAKSRFLATMSHEIRTPMNGVIGMTELLLLTPLNDEQREYTEIIRDSGQSLLRVLNDILDYSKIEAGKLELETVQFDLPGQVESVVELLRPGFTGKGVRLSTHIDPDVRTAVVGDPGRLRQILLNLAGNALKFTSTGGDVKIRVSTSVPAGDVTPVRVTIVDTGIGIPADVVDRLFQPFSQGDESTTRKFGGTGLGLSISAELVTLMGGQIGVTSEPGSGSEFWFVIPFPLAPNSQMVADARKPLVPRREPAPLRAERILLVEDNEINTFLALKQLQRLGFAVTSVTNGRQAVDTVDRERYDLVLMDCHMPEMDGFEATRVIRRRETGSMHLPIVAMTADARDEDHQNCLLAGMDDYISKPTNLDSLKVVLDRWLPAPERRRAIRNGTLPYSTAPTLGTSMLLELFNGDRAAVLDLLAAALGAINLDVKRVEVAAAARDFETAADGAHRLKGTSGSIRSGRLGEISAAIEAEARSVPAAISPALLAELRAAVVAVTAEVQSLRKSADSASLR